MEYKLRTDAEASELSAEEAVSKTVEYITEAVK